MKPLSIKDGIIAKCGKVGREGLYIMVVIILIQTCEITDNAERLESIENKISHIEQILGDDLSNSYQP